MQWAQCRIKEGGNLVDWSTAQWKAFGSDEVMVNKEEVCRKRRASLLIVSERKKKFADTLIFCTNVLGGEIAVARDNVTAQEMIAVMKIVGEDKCGTKFYIGYTDTEEEGKFVSLLICFCL